MGAAGVVAVVILLALIVLILNFGRLWVTAWSAGAAGAHVRARGDVGCVR